jgi:DNA-binding transcriptional LysR family regulator
MHRIGFSDAPGRCARRPGRRGPHPAGDRPARRRCPGRAAGRQGPAHRSRADSFEDVLGLCAAVLAVHVVGASAAVSHARPDVRFLPIEETSQVTCHLLRPGSPAPAACEALVAGIVRETAAG